MQCKTDLCMVRGCWLNQPHFSGHLTSWKDCRAAQQLLVWLCASSMSCMQACLCATTAAACRAGKGCITSKPAVTDCKTHVLKAAWQASCSSALMVPWCTRVIAVVLMNWASPLATLRAACSLPCSAHHRLIRSDHMLGCMVGSSCIKARDRHDRA